MDTVCLTSLGWIRQREKSALLVTRVAAAAQALPKSLHVDMASLMREQPGTQLDGYPLVEIAFSSWLKDGVTEDGVLDIEKIRLAPHDFPQGGIVIMNAAGFKSDIVVQALHQLRLAMYPMTEWPAVFTLVIDDAQMFQVSPVLANTFHLHPGVQLQTTIQRGVRQFMQYTRLLRIFGRNVGVVAKTMRWFLNLSHRAHEQRVNRGLGWTWEE